MRRHTRLTIRHSSRIKVTNRLSGEPMGFVGDVSLGGLKLVSSQPLAVGGCYEMRLHVPERNGQIRQVDVAMICQWSRKDPRRDRFEMGFALDRPSPDFTKLVERMSPGAGSWPRR